MEEDDKGCPLIMMGVSGGMFLLVPAYPGSPGQKAVKRLCVCVCSAARRYSGGCPALSSSHAAARCTAANASSATLSADVGS